VTTEIVWLSNEEVAHQADVKRQVLNRLRRARGQLDAIINTVEGDGECRAVVTQLAAVAAAVKRAGFVIVASGMKRCLSPAEPGVASDCSSMENLSVEELEKLFLMLS